MVDVQNAQRPSQATEQFKLGRTDVEPDLSDRAKRRWWLALATNRSGHPGLDSSAAGSISAPAATPRASDTYTAPFHRAPLGRAACRSWHAGRPLLDLPEIPPCHWSIGTVMAVAGTVVIKEPSWAMGSGSRCLLLCGSGDASCLGRNFGLAAASPHQPQPRPGGVEVDSPWIGAGGQRRCLCARPLQAPIFRGGRWSQANRGGPGGAAGLCRQQSPCCLLAAVLALSRACGNGARLKCCAPTVLGLACPATHNWESPPSASPPGRSERHSRRRSRSLQPGEPSRVPRLCPTNWAGQSQPRSCGSWASLAFRAAGDHRVSQSPRQARPRSDTPIYCRAR